MRTLALLLAAAMLGLFAPAASGGTLILQPSADAGLPFWCDWGYDWDERCYADEGPRLPIGGVDNKVWRAALRFSLAQIPAGAGVTSASLRVYYDRVCVAPRLTSTPCPHRGYTIDAHRILSANWYSEREPELDDRIASTAVVPAGAAPHWLSWNLTALVRAWKQGLARNNGVLLKLADGQEDYDVSGPYVPSAGYSDSALRPRLVIVYTAPSG